MEIKPIILISVIYLIIVPVIIVFVKGAKTCKRQKSYDHSRLKLKLKLKQKD